MPPMVLAYEVVFLEVGVVFLATMKVNLLLLVLLLLLMLAKCYSCNYWATEMSYVIFVFHES